MLVVWVVSRLFFCTRVGAILSDSGQGGQVWADHNSAMAAQTPTVNPACSSPPGPSPGELSLLYFPTFGVIVQYSSPPPVFNFFRKL